jgi:hypothetical protein
MIESMNINEIIVAIEGVKGHAYKQKCSVKKNQQQKC